MARPERPYQAPKPDTVVRALLAYCKSRDWAGADPYDALNSAVLSRLPRFGTRFTRLALTQFLKRSPVDLRGMLRIAPSQNPKALALALRATCKLDAAGGYDTVGVGAYLAERLVALRSPESTYWCWGYSFPWQTRTVLVPRAAPNLVCTVFVADALLDAWLTTHDVRLFQMAESAAQYIARELYFEVSPGRASFAYPLHGQRSHVHNANLIAAALLIRVYTQNGDSELLARGLAAARYSASMQRPDGSWAYGEAARQQWMDNFHTGYNLTALGTIGTALATTEFVEHVHLGFDFYRRHFIRADGAPRYYHNRNFPIDIHCVAQSILTLLEFSTVDPSARLSALKVFDWAVANMWDPAGFFYYRRLRFVTVKISYMRWSQAWMLLALSTLIGDIQTAGRSSTTRTSEASR